MAYEKLTLKKVEVKFAAVIDPVLNYERDGYEYVISVKPTKEQVNKLRDKGCEKQIKDGFIKFNKDTHSRKGEELPPVQVVGHNPREPFTDKVGNGSVCNVRLILIPYEYRKKKGVSFKLDAVQVIEHVPYVREPDTEGFDDYSGDTEGFDSNSEEEI